MRPPRTPVAELFEEAFRLYRRHWRVIIPVNAVFQLPIVLLALPFNVWQLQFTRGPLGTGTFERSDPEAVRAVLGQAGLIVLAALALAIAASILGTFAEAGIAYIVGRARNGDEPPMREVFLALRRLAGPILRLVAILFVALVLGVIGLAVAVAIVAVLAAALAGSTSGAALAGLATIIALCAFVVGVIVVVVRFSLAVPALALERLRPMDAFRRSWYLVKGATLRTLGILLLASIVVGLLSSVVSPVFLPGVFEGVMSGSISAWIVVTVLSGIIQFVVGPVLPILLAVLFLDYAAYSART